MARVFHKGRHIRETGHQAQPGRWKPPPDLQQAGAKLAEAHGGAGRSLQKDGERRRGGPLGRGPE